MLRVYVVLWASLLSVVPIAFADFIPRIHHVLRDDAQQRKASRAPPADSASFSVPLLPNTNYDPSELDLLTDSIVRYGTFKNAADYPLLRAHLDVLGLLEATLGLVENALSPLLPHAPALQRKGLLDRLLPLELDLGSDPSPDKELLGLDVNLDASAEISVSAKQTLVDPGWDNATSTRLVNSQSDTAVSDVH